MLLLNRRQVGRNQHIIHNVIYTLRGGKFLRKRKRSRYFAHLVKYYPRVYYTEHLTFVILLLRQSNRNRLQSRRKHGY